MAYFQQFLKNEYLLFFLNFQFISFRVIFHFRFQFHYFSYLSIRGKLIVLSIKRLKLLSFKIIHLRCEENYYYYIFYYYYYYDSY